jgi:hypothetical protein
MRLIGLILSNSCASVKSKSENPKFLYTGF